MQWGGLSGVVTSTWHLIAILIRNNNNNIFTMDCHHFPLISPLFVYVPQDIDYAPIHQPTVFPNNNAPVESVAQTYLVHSNLIYVEICDLEIGYSS